MNKLKYLLSIAIVFIILPNTIYADCTEEEISHFKEIEDDYNGICEVARRAVESGEFED